MDIDYLMRPEPTMTVADLHERFATEGVRTVAVMSEAIEVDAQEAKTISGKEHGSKKKWEVPLNGSLGHLANWLDIPRPFLERQDPEVQQYLLTHLLSRKPGEVEIDITDYGISEIRPAGLGRMDPRPVIEVAGKVVGEDAPVIDGFRDLKEYRFDVVVKDGSDRVGGDKPKGADKVGDITKGGLRFGQDTQHRLAPWVNTFLYRLVCTNGMEIARVGAPVSLRQSSEAMAADLEAAAMEQMALVTHQIEAFYDLRNKKIEDPYALLRRYSQEGRYPARVLGRLEDNLPQYMDPQEASMFDVVNLITNQANHPDLLERPNARRALESAGGAAVESHSHRCRTCQGVLA